MEHVDHGNELISLEAKPETASRKSDWPLRSYGTRSKGTSPAGRLDDRRIASSTGIAFSRLWAMSRNLEAGSSIAGSTALTAMARIGFAARALVYLLVGGFATAAALGFGAQPHGIMDAVRAVADTGLQIVLAAIIGVGLACLAAYFAITGLRRCWRARGTRAWLFAAGMIGDAIVYAAVMISVLGIVVGWQLSGEQQTQTWAAWVLAHPFGRGLIGFVGFIILACGVGVTVWVTTTDIDRDVDLPEDQKRAIQPVGRIGLAGRGLAVLLVGIYWLSAAMHGEPSQAHELGGALQTVQQNRYGWMLLLPLGVAFIASASFDFIEALYHEPRLLRSKPPPTATRRDARA